MTSMDAPREMAEDAVAETELTSVGGLGRRAVRNTGIVLGARISSRVVALVTIIATSHYLGAVVFGNNQTVVTYAALANVTLDLGYGTLFVREGSRHKDQIGHYMGTVLSYKTLTALVSSVVIAALLSFAGLQSLIIPAFALMVTSSYSNMIRSTCYAVGRLGYESFAIVVETLLLLALVLWGIHTHQPPAWFIWTYVIQYSVTSVYFIIVVIATGMARPSHYLDYQLLRRWFKTSVAVGLTAVVTTVYFTVDVPILQHFDPTNGQVGWYTLAYRPFQALLFIPFTLRNIVFPVVSVYFSAKSERVQLASEKLFRILLLLGWPCAVGLFVMAHQANSLLELYPQSEPALRILAIGILFSFVDNTFVASLLAMNRQALFARVAVFGLVFNLVLDFSLIPRYGYIGASWATVVTEAVLVCCGWWCMRHVGVPIRVFRLGWKIILAGTIMGLVLLPMSQWHGLAVLGVAALGGVVYVAILLVLRTADHEEWLLMRRAVGR